MKLDILSAPVSSNIADLPSSDFGVSKKKLRKLLHIATNNLYANPVQATVQEISQNSYDAHRLADKSDVPFIVTLPTAFEPTFSVRDFGAGIPHSYMLGGYSQLLESTKDTDDDAAGGWGLGRLSVLALTSTYSVTTFIKGVQRLYTIFKDDAEIRVVFLGESETKESDGTLVSAAIPTKDIPAFGAVIRSAYRYYKTQPILKNASGVSMEVPEYVVEGDGWALEKRAGCTVVCGIYHYAVDTHSIYGLTSEQSQVLNSSGLTMFFSASDLAVQANRQGLFYNDKTCEAIKATINVIIKELTVKIQGQFDKCASHLQARYLWNDVFNNNSSPYSGVIRNFKHDVFTWKGIPVKSARIEKPLQFSKPEDSYQADYFTTRYPRRGGGGRIPSHVPSPEYIPLDKGNTLYINDLPGHRGHYLRARSVIRERLSSTSNGTGVHCTVLTFETPAAQATFLKENHLTANDFIKISTVNIIRGALSDAARTRAKSKVFTFNGVTFSPYSRGWDVAEVDLDDDAEFIYVPINSYKPVFGLKGDCQRTQSPSELLDAISALKLITNSSPVIYGIREGSEELKQVLEKDNWTSLTDYIEDAVKNFQISPKILSLRADKQEAAKIGYEFPFSSFCDYHAYQVQDLKHDGFRTALQDLLKIKKAYRECEATERGDKAFCALLRLCARDSDAISVPAASVKIEDIRSKILSLHPFVKFFNRSMDGAMVKEFDALLCQNNS